MVPNIAASQTVDAKVRHGNLPGMPSCRLLPGRPPRSILTGHVLLRTIKCNFRSTSKVEHGSDAPQARCVPHGTLIGRSPINATQGDRGTDCELPQQQRSHAACPSIATPWDACFAYNSPMKVTGLMAITWRQQMSIDEGVIDADHRCLIDLVNDVDAVMPGPAMPAELAVILARLHAYAGLHFEREERLQIQTAFTYQQAHHKRHASLLRDLDVMRVACEKAFSPQQLKEFHASLSDFLYHWLVDHIVKADVLMKPFVSEMKQNAPAMISLAEAVRLSATERETERATAFGQVSPPDLESFTWREPSMS